MDNNQFSNYQLMFEVSFLPQAINYFRLKNYCYYEQYLIELINTKISEHLIQDKLHIGINIIDIIPQIPEDVFSLDKFQENVKETVEEKGYKISFNNDSRSLTISFEIK